MLSWDCRSSSGGTRSGKPKCPPDSDAGADMGSAVAGGLGGAVGGLFGAKKKKPVDCEQ